MKRAFITGITGQDGSHLAELLVSKGYEVHGMVRRSSTLTTQRIGHLYAEPQEPDAKLRLHYGDMTDAGCLHSLINSIQPDEVYNLAAQSHVRVSFDQPVFTADVVGLGTMRLLEAVRDYSRWHPVRYYQASSSEMFGNAKAPQSEATPFDPRSPYAVAKVMAYHTTVNYREAYGLHASNGILFNHESPRRGETFVTRKIAKAAARIAAGVQDALYLGNMEARRDWGFAGDYVEAMWLMLQQDQPDDYVISTGESHSVREFCDEAFRCVGLDYRHYVKQDARYGRPSEVDALEGDASKARETLGWVPRLGFRDLVRMMVGAEVEQISGRTETQCQ